MAHNYHDIHGSRIYFLPAHPFTHTFTEGFLLLIPYLAFFEVIYSFSRELLLLLLSSLLQLIHI